jgi:5-methylcytosine-specific restriction endonuclease McrA
MSMTPEERRIYNAKWYAANKERIAARSAAYYVANREQIRAAQAARPDNTALERAARYRAAHPARVKTAEATWRAANREQCIINNHRTRASNLDSPVNTLDLFDWRELLNQYDNRCAYCRADGALEIEHKTPLTRGGENSKRNVVPACRSCNTRKQDKTVSEFLAVA